MLEDLTIKDFALIDSDYLEFKKGFTVLSGETGAGKSILIGALSFLLGGKADSTCIRSGKSEANVSGTFLLSDSQLKVFDEINEDEPKTAGEWLSVHGIEAENNRVLLRRYIKDSGKSAAWINGTSVTRADLAQFSAFLVDIHGQHEHQSLMKVPEHRKFLDGRAGIEKKVDEFTKKYSLLVSLRKQLAEYSMSESERLRKLDMMKFAFEEISQAKLLKDEDKTLEDEESRLSSFEKIYSDVEEINQVLNGSENSLVSMLKKISRTSQSVSEMDKSVQPLSERIESAFYELSDLAEEYSDYQQKLVFDPKRLETVQERLSVIYNLKKKYASSVNAPLSEVFDYFENAKKYLEENSEGAGQKEVLENKIKVLEKDVLKSAEEISVVRKQTAGILENEIHSILSELGMPSTRFVVNIAQKSGTETVQLCGPYGKDDVEFLISANPGNPPLPLSKIASGGELSRVMLALKTIFARTDSVETLIFDEIDTGIGGEVAVAVGLHLRNLAENRQIFCITHLASIAVYADNQIKISKGLENGKTVSAVHPVTGEERVSEVARMLSGDADSSASIEHARSMLLKYSGGF